jgi:hypothetical protein
VVCGSCYKAVRDNPQACAAVLADLLGLHPGTAVKWSKITKRDWTSYLASRDPIL